jgi:hypothetical protein
MLSAQPTIRQKFIAGAASVLALLGAANLSGPSANAQQLSLNAPQFTELQCKTIATTTTEVFEALGAQKLSVDFRRSVIDFIIPDGRTVTCTGPRQIAWRDRSDWAAFHTIRAQLLGSRVPISLEGIVELAPRPVASLSLQ